MKNWRTLLLAVTVLGAALTARAFPVLADPGDGQGRFSLFDEAKRIVGGLFPGVSAVDLSSVACALTGPPTQPPADNCSNPPPYNVTDSGITWKPPGNNRPTLSQIKTLSTFYDMSATDCGGGSPRFVIFTSAHSLQGYFGPPPNFTGCPVGWQNTGNFADPADPAHRWGVDNGGTYVPWSTIVGSYGSLTVTSIILVVDGGWKDAPRGQDAVIDRFTVNNDVLSGAPDRGD